MHTGITNKVERVILKVVSILPLDSRVRIKEDLKITSPYLGLEMVLDSRPLLGRLKIKEPETIEWLKKIKKGEVFYDIGACVGNFALPAAKKGACVSAFEPMYLNYKVLVTNASINSLKIISFPIALSSHNGVGFMNLSKAVAGAAEHSFGGDHGKSTIMFALDDFRSLMKFPPPDYVKIDTDGHEEEVIRGAKETLRHAKSILVEIDFAQPNKAKELLEAIGFRMRNRFPRHASIYNCIFEK
jgi:FkbM family methyltransferase